MDGRYLANSNQQVFPNKRANPLVPTIFFLINERTPYCQLYFQINSFLNFEIRNSKFDFMKFENWIFEIWNLKIEFSKFEIWKLNFWNLKLEFWNLEVSSLLAVLVVVLVVCECLKPRHFKMDLAHLLQVRNSRCVSSVSSVSSFFNILYYFIVTTQQDNCIVVVLLLYCIINIVGRKCY